MFAAGERVFVCDVWRDDHLQMAAAAAVRLNRSVLWVGSAGLAEYLPSVLGLAAAPTGKNPVEPNPAAGKPVVVLAGSVSNVTRVQVGMLKRRADVAYVEADPCDLLQPETAMREIGRCLNAALNAIKTNKNVVITTGYDRDVVDKVRGKAQSLNLSIQQTSEGIAATLGELCRRIATGAELSGLVLTGGDTARSCCSLLSATGFKVLEEVAPGNPFWSAEGWSLRWFEGRYEGGRFRRGGCPVQSGGLPQIGEAGRSRTMKRGAKYRPVIGITMGGRRRRRAGDHRKGPHGQKNLRPLPAPDHRGQGHHGKGRCHREGPR